MIDVIEILQHWHAGRPKTVVAASLGGRPEDGAQVCGAGGGAGLAPGGPPLSRAEWATMVAGWFPELVDAKARSLTWPLIDAHRERIEPMLATNTVTTVASAATRRARFGGGSDRQLPALRAARVARRGQAASKVTVLRPPVVPGEEAQIDYGFLGSWLDPIAQRVRRVWAFVMVLACSRHMFVRPVLRWTRRHGSPAMSRRMSRFVLKFGGDPELAQAT